MPPQLAIGIEVFFAANKTINFSYPNMYLIVSFPLNKH